MKWVVPPQTIVKQKYVKLQSGKIFIANRGKPTSHTFYKRTDQVDSMKQRNATAPNFIHSLDAAHVALFTEA